MGQESFSRGRSLIGQVLLVLLLIFVLAIFVFPRLTRPPHQHTDLRQRSQLHSISTALLLFENEFEGLPPSDANDPVGVPCSGAMKLCEAVMGQDLLGVHSQSVFRADGLDRKGAVTLYPENANRLDPADRDKNLKARRGPYLQPENANAYRLAEIYGEGNTGPFPEDAFVLCGVYGCKTAGGMKTGMPILYYRARPGRTAHDVDDPNNPENIYDYRDNYALVCLGVPGQPGTVHPLSDSKRFYMMIQAKSSDSPRPYRADSFILISAGYDGLYGTDDDICNFDWD